MFKRNALITFALLALLLTACGAPATSPTASSPAVGPTAEPTATTAAVEPTTEPTTAPEAKVTITVWDYYGEATPIKPLIESFEKENPNITVQYEALDWDTTLEKMNV